MSPSLAYRLKACWRLLTASRWVVFTTHDTDKSKGNTVHYRVSWDKPRLMDVDGIRQWCEEVIHDTDACNDALRQAKDLLP